METVGIIYPPTELRIIVDTTAQFVSRNGKDFESKILLNEGSKTKFGFLLPENPYHEYYKMRIEDFIKNPNLEIEKPKKIKESVISKKPTNISREIPTQDPFPYSYGIELPNGINGYELDLIKLTAQYVARIGNQFLSALSGRENKNSQYDFLKIHHKYYPLFTNLVEIYKKILIPPPNMIQDLLKYSDQKLKLLPILYSKAEWENIQKNSEKKEDVVESNQIDWQDFIIVETIQFTMDDYINTINQDKQEEKIQDIIEEEEIMNEENVKIVKNYVKNKPTEKEPIQQMVIDPISGKMIPLNQINEQIREELIHPQWKIQKEKELEKFKTTNLSSGEELTKNLSNMFEKEKKKRKLE